MRFLPILERELRVAARQPKTWWRRVAAMGAALVVFAFGYLIASQMGGSSRVGRALFIALSVLGFLYALLAGPLLSADCLSRERREGTLGLLFLTDLRGYDVVLGKIAAASFDMVLALAAALPLAALPFLMGGLSLLQFAWIALTLANSLFLSLAVGALASSFFTSGRSALALSLGALLLLALGLPILGELVRISYNSPSAAIFYCVCPSFSLGLCLEFSARGLAGRYWVNAAGMQLLAWTCLALASWRTWLAWRDRPESVRRRRWRERVRQWRRGSVKWRRRWRRVALELNPVTWLEGRDHLQERLLWALCLAALIFWALKHLHSPEEWPDQETMILWPLWAHYILCLWLGVQAPRRFADDKQSGALELLLCTPLSVAEIVGGSMALLRRRFGRALLTLMVLDLFLFWAWFSEHGGWDKLGSSDGTGLVGAFVCGLLVFPFQGWCLARIGLYQGLVQSNSTRATFLVLFKVGVLPWVLFAVIMLVSQIWLRRYLSATYFSGTTAELFGFASWAGAHLLPGAVFLAWADWQLRRNFRALASTSGRRPWWRRRALLAR